MIDLALPPKKPIIELPRPAIILPHKRVITPAEARGIRTKPSLEEFLIAGWTAAGHGARSAAAGGKSVVYLGRANNNNNNSPNYNYDFTSQPLGDEAADRIIVCLYYARAQYPSFQNLEISSTGSNVASVAPNPVSTAEHSGDGNAMMWGIHAVPTGTTGTVRNRVLGSGTIDDAGIFLWACYGFTGTEGNGAADKDTNSLDASINVSAGEAVFAGGISSDTASRAVTWAGVTEDYSGEGSNTMKFVGHAIAESTESPRTVTASLASGGSDQRFGAFALS